MPRIAIEMLVKHLPGARDPLAAPHPWYVLMEVSSGRGESDAHELTLRSLAAALAEGTVADAAIATSLAQAQDFWRMRHGLSEIQKHEGGSIKHDVSVPIERMPELIRARQRSGGEDRSPASRPVPFGHLGDGNLHFNFSQPVGADREAFMARAPEVHQIVHRIVTRDGRLDRRRARHRPLQARAAEGREERGGA